MTERFTNVTDMKNAYREEIERLRARIAELEREVEKWMTPSVVRARDEAWSRAEKAEARLAALETVVEAAKRFVAAQGTLVDAAITGSELVAAVDALRAGEEKQ